MLKILEQLVLSQDIKDFKFSTAQFEGEELETLTLFFSSGRKLEVSPFNKNLFILGTLTCLKCERFASWKYIPSENFVYCNEHVPRGCSCNYLYDEEWDNDPDYFTIVLTDFDGLEEPCCEFLFVENNF